MLLARRSIQIPEYLYHDPSLRNKEQKTVAMIKAELFGSPQKEWYHDPYLQDEYGFTVAMQFAQHKFKVPEVWRHHPLIKNKFGYTVALIYASNGMAPPQEWEHNKYIRTSQGYHFLTVQNLLKKNSSFNKVPEQWKYSTFPYQDDNTKAILSAEKGIIPDEKQQHDPIQSNKIGNTVGILLAQHGIVSPSNWYHSVNIYNRDQQSIQTYLQQHEIIQFNGYKIFNLICEVYDCDNQYDCETYDEENQNNADNDKIIQQILNNNTEQPQSVQNIISVDKNSQQNIQQSTNLTNRMTFVGPVKINSPPNYPLPIYIFISQQFTQLQSNQQNIVQEIQQNQYQQVYDTYKLIQSQILNQNNQVNSYQDTIQQVFPLKTSPSFSSITLQHQSDVNNSSTNNVATNAPNNTNNIASNTTTVNNTQNQHKIPHIEIISAETTYHNTQQQQNTTKTPYQPTEVNFKPPQTCMICFTTGKNFIKTKCGHKVCLSCFNQLQTNKIYDKCPVCRQKDWIQRFSDFILFNCFM